MNSENLYQNPSSSTDPQSVGVITGASSGLGEHYARQLAQNGYSLILVARREARLRSLALELSKSYPITLWTVPMDLNQPHAAKKLFEHCTSLVKEITLVINNAGIGKYGRFFDFSLQEQLATLNLNLTVPTELSYYFLKHMRHHQKPSYLHYVASIAAFQPTPCFSVYSASKTYLRTFVETLALECAGSSVSVSCTCPGGTYTEFMSQSGQIITSAGHRFMMRPENVVASSLKALFQHQVLHVPGFWNKVACFLPRILPRTISLKLAQMIMNRTVQKPYPQEPKTESVD